MNGWSRALCRAPAGPQLKRDSLGGLERRRLRAVLLVVALDVGTKRWETLILT
jgi:hypothetical protein